MNDQTIAQVDILEEDNVTLNHKLESQLSYSKILSEENNMLRLLIESMNEQLSLKEGQLEVVRENNKILELTIKKLKKEAE